MLWSICQENSSIKWRWIMEKKKKNDFFSLSLWLCQWHDSFDTFTGRIRIQENRLKNKEWPNHKHYAFFRKNIVLSYRQVLFWRWCKLIQNWWKTIWRLFHGIIERSIQIQPFYRTHVIRIDNLSLRTYKKSQINQKKSLNR